MRNGSASWTTLLVLACVLAAGCAGLGARVEPDPSLPLPAPAPTLPPGLALAGAAEAWRDATSAELVWEGAVEPGAVRVPLVGEQVVDRFERADLALPAGVPLVIHARLGWNGSADLRLLVREGDAWRCATDAREGGTLSAIEGEESCRMAVEAGPARSWQVDVVNVEGAAERVPFQVTLRVSTYAPAPRYDLAAGPAPRASVPDPTLPGPHDVASAEYDFGAMLLEDRVTKRPYPVRLLGVVHHPVGDEGEGEWPLVVFLHGRASWCTGPAGALWVFSHCRAPAPAGANVPSHRGYDEDARLLASHGYVVASIDANDVNAMDSPGRGVPNGDDGTDARARLLLRTLDEWRKVHEQGGAPANPALDALRGRLDLSRVGLMGHSRGAEGVTRAPSHAEETGHWSAGAIRAVYSLAGTTRFHLPDYRMPLVKGPVAYLSVAPYCDGDVRDLGNLDYYDALRLDPERGHLAHLLFMGSNHNHYNAAWTSDDAAHAWEHDPYCGAEEHAYGRLSREDQARHQRAYLPAWFRLHLGNESSFRPLFTGDAAPPASACPERLASCPGLVHVTHQPLPGDVLTLEDAATADALAANDLGGPSLFTGFADASWCDPRDSPPEDPCARPRSLGLAPRLRLAWTDAPAHASWRTEMPAEAADLSGYDALALRIAVDVPDDAPPGGHAPRVTLVLEDAHGRRAEAHANDHGAAIFAPPGHGSRRIAMNQIRIPLDAFPGVDLARVAAIEMRVAAATPGAVQVADLAALRTS